MKEGEFLEATQVADQIAEVNPHHFFSSIAAETYAKILDVFLSEQELDNESDEKLRVKLTSGALDHLEDAVNQGFTNRSLLDPDRKSHWGNFVELPRFQELINQIEP